MVLRCTEGRYGLWLVDTSTGAVRRLARGKILAAAFAPGQVGDGCRQLDVMGRVVPP